MSSPVVFALAAFALAYSTNAGIIGNAGLLSPLAAPGVLAAPWTGGLIDGRSLIQTPSATIIGPGSAGLATAPLIGTRLLAPAGVISTPSATIVGPSDGTLGGSIISRSLLAAPWTGAPLALNGW